MVGFDDDPVAKRKRRGIISKFSGFIKSFTTNVNFIVYSTGYGFLFKKRNIRVSRKLNEFLN
jgi:hypothetical protein